MDVDQINDKKIKICHGTSHSSSKMEHSTISSTSQPSSKQFVIESWNAVEDNSSSIEPQLDGSPHDDSRVDGVTVPDEIVRIDAIYFIA